MKVLIRADASAGIGSGHVMRCLALATELRASGATVTFASRDGPAGLCDSIRETGFTLAALDARARSSRKADSDETREVTAGERYDWIVVDHYALDSAWERAMRVQAHRILAIDDLADREHDCDVLLDQNYSGTESRYAGLVPAGCDQLLGPGFALLRSEFRLARESLRKRDGMLRRVLVYFGSADAAGATLRAVEALSLLQPADCSVEIVMGTANPHAPAIRTRCEMQPSFHLRAGNVDMVAAMSAADLSIGAGGITTWERCCMGVPSVVMAVADNQVPGSRALGRDGYVIFLGEAEKVSVEALAGTLRELASDPSRVVELSERSTTLVDGLGARRVANRMVAEGISLRRAGTADCERLLAWRNAPEVRARAKNPRVIGDDEHRQWYAGKLADPNCLLLIAELDGAPVGALRYDIDQDEAWVSIFLAPGMAGRGFGPRMLIRGNEWVRRHHPATRCLVAEILENNDRSARAFLSAGYARSGTIYRRLLGR